MVARCRRPDDPISSASPAEGKRRKSAPRAVATMSRRPVFVGGRCCWVRGTPARRGTCSGAPREVRECPPGAMAKPGCRARAGDRGRDPGRRASAAVALTTRCALRVALTTGHAREACGPSRRGCGGPCSLGGRAVGRGAQGVERPGSARRRGATSWAPGPGPRAARIGPRSWRGRTVLVDRRRPEPDVPGSGLAAPTSRSFWVHQTLKRSVPATDRPTCDTRGASCHHGPHAGTREGALERR